MSESDVMATLLYALSIVVFVIGYPLAALVFALATLAIVLVEGPQW